MNHPTKGERIAKAIAHSGLCSRRDAERLIEQGKVTVNGQKITQPAVNVTSDDIITVSGKPLIRQNLTRIWLYHKPTGVVTTHRDPQQRPTVFQQLPKELGHVISIGRLDINSEGLLLLTNNGEVARALELPATGWRRRYRVRAYGHVTQSQLDTLKKGVVVTHPKTGKKVKYDSITATLEPSSNGRNQWISFTLTEGKNREIRNICNHLDLQVNRLVRVAYGSFQLGKLPVNALKEVPQKMLKEQLGTLLDL